MIARRHTSLHYIIWSTLDGLKDTSVGPKALGKMMKLYTGLKFFYSEVKDTGWKIKN